MSRVQLALRVPDLASSVAFYSRLFGTEPAKLREGYANFAVAEPPLKLVLIEGAVDGTTLDHLGVEVESTERVRAATERLRDAGLAAFEENDTSCCYALQDKVWVHAPGREPWEVYVVKGDADTLAKVPASAAGEAVPGGASAPDTAAGTCCGVDSRRTDGEPAARAGSAPAAAAGGCGCGC